MNGYKTIISISSWSFILVISSFLFLRVGNWIDKLFNTEPTFMIGLFFLAVFLCIGRLYNEAWKKRNEN